MASELSFSTERRVAAVKGYDPTSASSRRIAKRTEEKMSPDMKDKRDKYIFAIVMGYPKRQAAMMAGFAERSATKQGSQLFHEPYVQTQIHLLREKISEERLTSRKEVIAGLLSEARNDGPDSKQSARVAAWAHVAKICGYEKPAQATIDVVHRGGVMLVPMPTSHEDWEQAAANAQKQLRDDVRK